MILSTEQFRWLNHVQKREKIQYERSEVDYEFMWENSQSGCT